MHRGFVPFVLAMVVVGCGGPAASSTTDPGDDDQPTGNELGVAGSVVGLDGVRVLATTAAITEPVNLEITSVPTPSAELADNITIVGGAYRIASDHDVVAPADSPLVIGLPVPAGVDTTHLMIMSVASTGAMLDGEATSRDVWVPMLGRYDATKHVMFSTLQELATAGATFVVATSPDVLSPENPTSSLRAGGSTDAVMISHDFVVVCMGFPNDECPGTAGFEMALELTSARNILLGLGYPEPRLEIVPLEIGGVNTFIGTGYYAYLVPNNQGRCWTDDIVRGGVYYQPRGKLFVCLPQGATTLGNVATVDHEYFHAEQYAFHNVYVHDDEPALIEGTASMSEKSLRAPDLHRSPDVLPMHPLDVNILSSDDELEYESQDLWIYIGRQAGAGLEYLIPVFTAAASLDDISSALPGGDLHDAYFAMATSNLMEKHELYDGFLLPDCVLENFIFLSDQLEIWKSPLPQPGHDLPPLTSYAVQMSFVDFPRIRASNTSGDSNIRIRVYEQDDCNPQPDVFQSLDNKVYYMVVVNTSFDSTAHFQLGIQRL